MNPTSLGVILPVAATGCNFRTLRPDGRSVFLWERHLAAFRFPWHVKLDFRQAAGKLCRVPVFAVSQPPPDANMPHAPRCFAIRIAIALAVGGAMAPHGVWAQQDHGAEESGRTLTSDVASTAPLSLSPLVEAAERHRIDAIARAKPTATSVFVPGGGGGGSGVVISPDGFALTNFHVSSPAGTYMQCSLANGELYDAIIVGIDPVGDLAMIQLLGRDDFPAAEIGSSLAARPGDWSFVIGNPFLLAGDLQPTVTWGILSGVSRYQYPSGTLLEYGDCLQTDASINPGNSGGPIYDADGKLLGIVGRASFEKRGRVNVGVGYAISINQAMNFAGSLRVGRIVDHATLGATVATDPDGGVRVTNILEFSDAYRRGLRYDSEILSIDGRAVTTANEVQNILATFPARWRIPLVFREDGKRVETIVRLQSVHQFDELLEKMAGSMPPPPPVPDKPPADPGDKKQRGPSRPNDFQDDDFHNEDSEDDPRGKSPHGGRAKSIPEVAANRIIERRGYANYFFNLDEQNQFIEAIRQADFSKGIASSDNDQSTVWKITGTTDSGQPVRLQIGETDSLLSIGDTALRLESEEDAYQAVSEASPLAMVAALSSLRRMIRLGPDRFGETYASGSAPLGGMRPLRRVMTATDGEMEVQFLTHPDDRRLEVIEVFADRDTDPAELWFDGDSATEVPQSITLKFGTETQVQVKIESWTVATVGGNDDAG